MKKHMQKSKSQVLAELRDAKVNKDLAMGMKISEMIAILALWDGYDWEPSEIKHFYTMYGRFLEQYHFGEINSNDLSDIIDDIKNRLDIDLLAPVIVGDESAAPSKPVEAIKCITLQEALNRQDWDKVDPMKAVDVRMTYSDLMCICKWTHNRKK